MRAMFPRTLLRPAVAALLAAVLLSAAAPIGAAEQGRTAGEDVAVIVHPDVPIDNLTFAELRRVDVSSGFGEILLVEQ